MIIFVKNSTHFTPFAISPVTETIFVFWGERMDLKKRKILQVSTSKSQFKEFAYCLLNQVLPVSLSKRTRPLAAVAVAQGQPLILLLARVPISCFIILGFAIQWWIRLRPS